MSLHVLDSQKKPKLGQIFSHFVGVTCIAFAIGTSVFAQALDQNQDLVIRYLLGVQQEEPDIFDQTVKYNIDVMVLIRDQLDLENKLRVQGMLPSSPRTLLSIAVSSRPQAEKNDVKISEESLTDWRERLFTVFHRIPSSEVHLARFVDNQVQVLQQKLKGHSSQGLLTGLTQFLSKEQRQEVFKEDSFEEKLRLLRDRLPETLPESFRGKDHGFGETVSRTEALNQAKDLREIEQELDQWALLQISLQERDGSFPQSRSAWENRIQTLSRNDFQNLVDKNTFQFRTAKLPGQNKALQQRLQSQIKDWIERREIQPMSAGRFLKIQEVPPEIGIFRGCFGGDCSTSHSFAYPNDPNEHVFVIRSLDGSPKGYAAGTVVEANSKRTFYLHTMNGSHLSAEDTKMVLEGIRGSLHDLQVDQLGLGVVGNINNLVNFIEIRSVLLEEASKGEGTEIKYLNPEVRSLIESQPYRFNHAHYDWMKENTQMVVIPSKPQMPELQTMISKNRNVFRVPHQIDLMQLKRLVLEVMLPQKNPDLAKICSDFKLNCKELESFYSHFVHPNPHKMRYQQYLESLRVEAKGLGLPPDILEKRQSFLINVLLHSPDIAALEHRKLALLVLKKAPNPSIHDFYRATFSQSLTPDMTSLIRELIENGDKEALKMLAYAFRAPYTSEIENLIRLLIKKADQETLQHLAMNAFRPRYTSEMANLLRLTIEKGDQKVLAMLAFTTFYPPYTPEIEDSIRLLIEKAENTTLMFNKDRIFPKENGYGSNYDILRKSVDILNQEERREFLRQHFEQRPITQVETCNLNLLK